MDYFMIVFVLINYYEYFIEKMISNIIFKFLLFILKKRFIYFLVFDVIRIYYVRIIYLIFFWLKCLVLVFYMLFVM